MPGMPLAHVSWAIADVLRPAEALCLLEPAPGDTRLRSGPLILSEIGRAALTDALRARALAPAHGPYRMVWFAGLRESQP